MTECLELAAKCLKVPADVQAGTSKQAGGSASKSPNVAVFLPRNTCLHQLSNSLTGADADLQTLCLERNYLNEQFKAVTLYLHVGKRHCEDRASADVCGDTDQSDSSIAA